MTTAKAILSLREKTGNTQRGLAERLGVTVGAISRWETGQREPNRATLKKLAAIAEAAEIDHLQAFFASMWTAGMINRIEKLHSAGAERPVSVNELRKWLEDMRHLHTALKDLADRWKDLPDGEKLRKLRAELFPLEVVGNEIEVYLTGSTEALTGKGKWNV